MKVEKAFSGGPILYRYVVKQSSLFLREQSQLSLDLEEMLVNQNIVMIQLLKRATLENRTQKSIFNLIIGLVDYIYMTY